MGDAAQEVLSAAPYALLRREPHPIQRPATPVSPAAAPAHTRSASTEKVSAKVDWVGDGEWSQSNPSRTRSMPAVSNGTNCIRVRQSAVIRSDKWSSLESLAHVVLGHQLEALVRVVLGHQLDDVVRRFARIFLSHEPDPDAVTPRSITAPPLFAPLLPAPRLPARTTPAPVVRALSDTCRVPSMATSLAARGAREPARSEMVLPAGQRVAPAPGKSRSEPGAGPGQGPRTRTSGCRCKEKRSELVCGSSGDSSDVKPAAPPPSSVKGTSRQVSAVFLLNLQGTVQTYLDREYDE